MAFRFALTALLAFVASVIGHPASAQIGPGGGVQQQGTVTANDCVKWVSTGVIADSGGACGGTATTIASGTTLVTGATNGNCLYNNAGTLGDKACGSTTLTVGTTTIASGTTTRILYDNAGVLGEYTLSGSGTVVAMQTSPALVTPALGVATATSLAIGGATLGANAFAVTGHLLLEGVTSTGATGTNLLVFATSPTLTTPALGVATATSLAIGGATIGANALAITGSESVSSTSNIIGALTLGTQQTTQGSIVLANTAAGAFATTIKSSNSATAAVTYTLPTAVGAAGTVLTDAAGNGVLSWAAGGGGITIGTTTITSGTTTRILYDNAGVVGEYTLTGTGTVVAMQASPTFTGVVTFASGTAAAPSVVLAASSTTGFFENNDGVVGSQLGVTANGTSVVRVVQGQFDLVGNGVLTWGNQVNSFSSSTSDVGIKRKTTGILEITAGNTGNPGALQLGSSTLALAAASLGFDKITASASAPGGGGGKIELVCGTNSGTLKAIIYGGTSATATTIIDNVGSGVSGC